MTKRYCKTCGTEIKNVEEWALECITEDNWQCRKCFYSKGEPVGPVLVDDTAGSTEPDTAVLTAA